LNFRHFDLDEYHYRWDTEIPYSALHTREHKTERLMDDISQSPRFVMSGQMWSIRKSFENFFDLGVYLFAPTKIRVERCRNRAIRRWGDRVLSGGDLYELNQESLRLAEQYDTAEPPAVRLTRDDEWAAELPCLWLKFC
jgi:hypothetical protein